MKKVLSLTILALLVAGAGAPIMAITYWAGNGDGTCMGHYILVDWVGYIRGNDFIGYWGEDEANDMNAYDRVVEDNGTYHVYYGTPGYWDSDGLEIDCFGPWWGVFDTGTGLCGGSWEEDENSTCGCTDGDWWGTQQ